ncbi:PD-(D/E)XK nuclease family protein [Aureivirga sp. CE67]|uniref:PD-(D/E)XK nuclease family protein n=1 Tax=Aureivirga sp. CE67 TaxID=1788983 RepID=UPI0018CB57E9|nr:PD-(D/E)XK nuclease family protein [Aureivirga sp. CE67]
MQTFLSEVVSSILKEEFPISDYTFILPSQRACVFLKDEIHKQVSEVTFLPKMTSIEHFIQEVAELKQMDNIQLLFEFYAVYKQHTDLEKIENFDEFSKWATMAIHDYNEIDRYLIPTKKFFENLQDINRINNWDVEKGEITELISKHLSFIHDLGVYYEALKNRLLEMKSAYQGLIYRESAAKIENYLQKSGLDKIVLVGFNALNNAEETMFKTILQNPLNRVFWDVDAMYFNSNSEAGMFLRKHKKWNYFDNHPFNWINKNLEKKKEIHYIAAPKNVSQMKYVGEILENLPTYENTALVLAEEAMLSLALNSLPKSVEKINITMGYPLKDIPVTSLFDLIFKLHLNQEKFHKKAEGSFYFKDVIAFLSHPYLKKITVTENHNIAIFLINQIRFKNYIFISKKDLMFEIENRNVEEFDFTEEEIEKFKLVSELFDTVYSTKEIIERCLSIIKILKNLTEGLEREYVYRFFKVFQQLENLNKQFNHITNIKTLQSFYYQLTANEKLSFQGEPLQGLQLMGVLETRVLDFDTVIMTSVNEGILPTGKSENSFIPHDVKNFYDLPTYYEKDAIFSYHFYRLIQRASKIYMIYNTEPDFYGAGEKSRFLTQLELYKKGIEYKILNPTVKAINKEPLTVPKTEEVIEKLKEFVKKGISPSALAMYIKDPIDFYEKRILGIRELEEVEETIEANTMGTIIHDVLYSLYIDYEGVNKCISLEDNAKMMSKFPILVENYFKKHYKNGNITSGKNRLIYEVSKNYVERFLKFEKSEIEKGREIKILKLEKEFRIKFNVDSIDFPIYLKGIVDRIDEVDGEERIIDYKTGRVTSSELKVTDFQNMISEDKYLKALQVMMYAYIYKKHQNENHEDVICGIFSFKNLKEKLIQLNFSTKRNVVDSKITEERFEQLEEQLRNIILDIFDLDKLFERKEV